MEESPFGSGISQRLPRDNPDDFSISPWKISMISLWFPMKSAVWLVKLPFLLVFNHDFWCLSHFQSLRFSSSILAFCLELSPSETAGHWRQLLQQLCGMSLGSRIMCDIGWWVDMGSVWCLAIGNPLLTIPSYDWDMKYLSDVYPFSQFTNLYLFLCFNWVYDTG